MRGRAGDVDGLQAEGLVDRVRKARGIGFLSRIALRIGQIFSLDLCTGLVGLDRRGRARCAGGCARGAGRISREGGSVALPGWCDLRQREAWGDMGGDQRQQAGDIRRYRARQIGGGAPPPTPPALF